jgi:hypothetical protein
MRIYISSTFKDLQAHRATLAAVLRKQGHQIIGMEDYVAEGAKPLDVCLRDVARCDVYVGILAWRFGFAPNVASAGAPTGARASITEHEYRRAKSDASKIVLMFVTDPSGTWPIEHIDAVSGSVEDAREIARLRKEVCDDNVVSFFSNPDQLASLATAAVYRAEMQSRLSLESLKVGPQTDSFFIREADLSSTSLMKISRAIAGPTEVNVLELDLGNGDQWWLSRLYFLCSLAVGVAEAEAIVFYTDIADTRTFVGMCTPSVLRERLGRLSAAFPEYELALDREPKKASVQQEVDRRTEVWRSQLKSEKQDAVLVTQRELRRWMGVDLIEQPVAWTKDESLNRQIERILDWPLRFVPIVENDRYIGVADKALLMERISRILIRDRWSDNQGR